MQFYLVFLTVPCANFALIEGRACANSG